MIESRMISVRRQIRNFDGQPVWLEFDVKSRLEFAVDELISSAWKLLIQGASCWRCWHLRSGRGGDLNHSLESVPVGLILVDLLLSNLAISVSDDCMTFCFYEVDRWNHAQRVRRLFEPEEI
jgi:hypothetical protein